MTTQIEREAPPGGDRPDRSARKPVRIAVRAADPITLTGLTCTLMGQQQLQVTSTSTAAEVDVLVYAVDAVTTSTVAGLRRAAAEFDVPIVLVTGEFDSAQLLSATECTVVAILHRNSATPARLQEAVLAAADGGAALPPKLLGELLRQVQALQQDVLTPRGLNTSGLTPREIDVVRLIAEGCDTEEIGNRLCYSERTVKNIIYTMTNRLRMRNRPHLVAYAVRTGVI
ncbi:LuxR C-terminal-related transcriptional regulator [Saccharopolyspora gloriosae]|uniref:helix-turn-helix transcriptional regulator n=1 Tax=Saccharopolyspora gloriosae TaxID=455344 RepID=UPI001FB6351C|nr:LuxR C-terminal-related transcriptional regulator [Saccharopolyspora gloriosae]